jgi:hypothetical protein
MMRLQRWENGPYFADFSLHIPDMRSFVHMRELVTIGPRFPMYLSNRCFASDDGCVVHPSWATFAMAMSVSLVLANSFGGRLVKFRTDVAEFASTKQTPPKAQEGSLSPTSSSWRSRPCTVAAAWRPSKDI